MTVISFVTEAATHTTTYRRKKSSEKVSAWIFLFSTFLLFLVGDDKHNYISEVAAYMKKVSLYSS